MSTAQKKVLVSGSIITFCLGIIYVWSIFQLPVMRLYGWSSADAAFTFNIMLVSFVLGILFGGKMQDKTGPRPVVLTSGILFAGGIFLASIIPAAYSWLFYVVYGGIAGFGVGLGFGSIIPCVQKWFPQKKGFAAGIIVCSFGASAIVVGPLANLLIGLLGLAVTFRIFAICFFAIIITFVWFIKNPETTPAQNADTDAFKAVQQQYPPRKTLKIRNFYFILLCMMFLVAAFFILSPMIKIFATDIGMSDPLAVVCVMVSGIASAAGGFVFPAISDTKGRKFSIYLMFIITLAACILMLFLQNILFYIIFVALISFCYGGPGGVFPVLVGDYYGTRNMGANYGIIMLGFAASALLFPFLARFIQRDDPATFLVFIIPIVTCVAGLVLLRVIRPPADSIQDNE